MGKTPVEFWSSWLQHSLKDDIPWIGAGRKVPGALRAPVPSPALAAPHFQHQGWSLQHQHQLWSRPCLAEPFTSPRVLFSLWFGSCLDFSKAPEQCAPFLPRPAHIVRISA